MKNRDTATSEEDEPIVMTADLIEWSSQIACGMEYLASRKVLHRDLATRNLLLACDNTVKICDFGLAKNTDAHGQCLGNDDEVLAFRWMAIESLQELRFSVQSDIWSFGITVWEIFSLSDEPYSDINSSEQLLLELLRGARLKQPMYANKEMYQIMRACWCLKQSDRPLFKILENRFRALLNTRSHDAESVHLDVELDTATWHA